MEWVGPTAAKTHQHAHPETEGAVAADRQTLSELTDEATRPGAERLAEWIDQVQAAPLKETASFANGLADWNAVAAAVTRLNTRRSLPCQFRAR